MEIQDQIAAVAEKLYYSRVFPKSPMWVNFQLKKKTNPKAILLAMNECLLKKPSNPWAYCEIVAKKSCPKFNAREFEDKANEDKNGFVALVDALKEFMEKRKSHDQRTT